MNNKYEHDTIIVSKYKLQNNNTVNVVLSFLVLALIIMPGASASSGYFEALKSVYGTTGTSCSTCHTSPPALNSYGNAFAAITGHSSDPTGALISIGVPPGVPAPTDTIPPETTLSGVTENGLYKDIVAITLTAADNPGGSGVKETIFSVNGGQTATYTVPFVVDRIGQDSVTYWSTDNAGNIEPQKMVNFTITSGSVIDDIPPETNINGVIENGLYNNNVAIAFIASDNPGGSGVRETMFSVNGGQTTTYTVPFIIVDTIGQDNVTYWSTDNEGNIESPKMVNFTFMPLINTTREIERKSILLGESTYITVSITNSVDQPLTLQEIIPEGWNIIVTSDDPDGFKNSTHEWVLLNMSPGVPKIITYTLTPPGNVSIGTYQINGTVRNGIGMVENVSGDDSVKIDILEFYRRLGSDPVILESGDLLEAIHDFRNSITPSGFDRPLNAQEMDELISEWINT